MHIQKRITLGIGVLFIMILLLGIQAVGYVRSLSEASGNILTDNYNSLTYAKNMMTSLDSLVYGDSASMPLCSRVFRSSRKILPKPTNSGLPTP